MHDTGHAGKGGDSIPSSSRRDCSGSGRLSPDDGGIRVPLVSPPGIFIPSDGPVHPGSEAIEFAIVVGCRDDGREGSCDGLQTQVSVPVPGMPEEPARLSDLLFCLPLPEIVPGA